MKQCFKNECLNFLAAYCWVRVASSTWNVSWLWKTNKGRL